MQVFVLKLQLQCCSCSVVQLCSFGYYRDMAETTVLLQDAIVDIVVRRGGQV